MTLHIETCTVDAIDPEALAGFWSKALGWRARRDSDGDVWVESPEAGASRGPAPTPLLFVSLPESKTHKNRVHLDLRPDDQSAEVERLLELGARRADVGQSGTEGWVVMSDPEGNEFCVLSSKGARDVATSG